MSEKKTYIVVKPWFGVNADDEFTTDNLHPSLKAHVREKGRRDNKAELTPATPSAATGEGNNRRGNR